MRVVNLDLIETLSCKNFVLLFFCLVKKSKHLRFICKKWFWLVKSLNVATLTRCHRSTSAVIHWDWHTSLSFSAHQTLLARDFTDNRNSALSFPTDNVIAIGNEAIKMAIKGFNLTAVFQNLTLCGADISLCPEAGALRLFSLFVQDQKVCPTTRSTDRQAAGIRWAHLLDHGEGERVRAF